jgi:hypothetical protein
MYYRNKFVTNSSSTSFVAWGYVLPEELFSKAGDDDFLDMVCEGAPGVEATTDEDGHVLIWASGSYIDGDAYQTVSFRSEPTGDTKKWEEEMKALALKLGADLGNLIPGWFFTHHAS